MKPINECKTAVNVPEQLLHLQEMIFGGLPKEDRHSFQRDFDRALADCNDPTYVWQRYMVWLLWEELEPITCFIANRVGILYERWGKGNKPTDDAFRAAATVASESRWAAAGRLPMYQYHVLLAVIFAAGAIHNPGLAGNAILEVAKAKGRFLARGKNRQREEERQSFQRQRDAMLKLLAMC